MPRGNKNGKSPGELLLPLKGARDLKKFRNQGDIGALKRAIAEFERAADMVPDGHPVRAVYLSNVGCFLHMLFLSCGNAEDLAKAIDTGKKAVAGTPVNHRSLSGTQANLAASLLAWFELTGNVDALDDSIEAAREAVRTVHGGRAGRAGAFNGLGNALQNRFELHGVADDLEAAILAGRQAVAASSRRDPQRPTCLTDLSTSLRVRFELSGDLHDIDEAITLARDATAPAPGNGHAWRLSNLGVALLARFTASSDPADLDSAIGELWKALTACVPADPGRARITGNLTGALFARYARTSNAADLTAAISIAHDAARSSSPGDPYCARLLSDLGRTLLARYRLTGQDSDLAAAIRCWQNAAALPAGPSSARLIAAVMWANAAADTGNIREAADGYAAAVELLPKVAWHGLSREKRQEQLAYWSGLASEAAAAAVLSGSAERAVELLELGRSVLWTQALSLRSDLAALAASYPALAERLQAIRMTMDNPLESSTARDAMKSTVASDLASGRHDTRIRLAQECDEIMSEIRAKPGFRHFLAPVPYSELAAGLTRGPAARGPVVMINPSRDGCHALITHPAAPRVQVIDLNLRLEEAKAQADRLVRALASRDRAALIEILGWLWSTITEPVLVKIGHTRARNANDPWPRVWWCPAGPLSFMPFHAAGRYNKDGSVYHEGDRALDRVISSYTTKLSALAPPESDTALTRARQLSVGIENHPALPALPAVATEMAALKNRFPAEAGHQQLLESKATREAVLSGLRGHSWLHFACHATVNYDNPDRSGFALWDNFLTLGDLARQPGRSRELAFLSACSTAKGSAQHPDEAIHLAAAMQFLGYRHIIAACWELDDSIAPDIACRVYARLTRHGWPDCTRTAEALHEAIRSLPRSQANPMLWAPYIHLGP